MNRLNHLSSVKSSAILITGALWLVSVALGGLAVFALRAVLMWGMAFLIPQPDTASRLETANVINFVQMCGSVVFGLAFLAVILYISERFFRDAGNPRLTRALVRLIVIEGVIVLPVWLLLWR
jgi:hypothetical protein